ncbi:MAG: hypothetical protein WBP46_18985 [Thiolinea sp.]
MPAIYNPPYDSPIEDIFARHYVNYASETIAFTPQASINTLCGVFILDFLLEDGSGYRVGIECDGKEFHDAARDEWRDAMILGEHHVDVIYRVRGSDIVYYMEDVLYILSKFEPSLFKHRATNNLSVLASYEAQQMAKSRDSESYIFEYKNSEDIGFLHLSARRYTVPTNERRFWQAAYTYALSIGGGKLTDVIDQYRKAHGIT